MVQEQATSISELLYNNAPPNNLDLLIIQERSEAMAMRIAKLREELKDLEHQLQLHKCVFSPARRIPTEVLTMIFDIASAKPPLLVDDADDSDCWERDRKDLSTISLVCKRWRDVAYNAGQLWAAHEAVIPELTRKQCDTLLRWYGRAKGTPKTLAFDTSYFNSKPCQCYKQTAGPHLCSNAGLRRLLKGGAPFSRISMGNFTPTCFKNIVCYIKSASATTTTTSTSQHWWDRVQKLVLDFHYGDANDKDPYWLQSQLPAQSIFTSFPDSLTSLTLHLPNLEERPQRKVLEIPATVLRKLVTFSLSYTWGGPQFLTALQHCTNVEDLSLRLGNREESGSANLGDQINVTSLSQDGHIVLPKVKSLLLKIKGASAVVEHIGVLRFPGLVKLCIKSEDEYDKPKPYSNIMQAIGLFSPAASQNFVSLSVVGYIKSADLYHLLGSLTSPLTHLATDATFDPQEFLKLALGAPAGSQNIVPCLRALHVRKFPVKYHLDSLLLYIKSRQKHGKKKGEVVMKAPFDGLKWVVLEIYGSDVKKQLYKESATLKILRGSFGIKVERLGYRPGESC
ncbi:hypothetical protein D9611_013304 [Ephemerocybe angulata]|uniref:F-box domain-containing protein n=1 Tax=Ephemerocybe angulata TaxID=980116 RepID=A0A8H5CB39_9AGAR|nr:hypothetical protein D9611_013304 [Tulosesus angulatus]